MIKILLRKSNLGCSESRRHFNGGHEAGQFHSCGFRFCGFFLTRFDLSCSLALIFFDLLKALSF